MGLPQLTMSNGIYWFLNRFKHECPYVVHILGIPAKIQGAVCVFSTTNDNWSH